MLSCIVSNVVNVSIVMLVFLSNLWYSIKKKEKKKKYGKFNVKLKTRRWTPKQSPDNLGCMLLRGGQLSGGLQKYVSFSINSLNLLKFHQNSGIKGRPLHSFLAILVQFSVPTNLFKNCIFK